VLVLAMENPGPRYDQTDLALAQILARRAALAVENARLYNDARSSLTEAQTALRIREEFLSIASHELRTPLTALKSNLQLARRRLSRGARPEQVSELVDHANDQTERLAGLVSDLLDVTRIAAGRLTIGCAPVAIGPLLCRVVETERAADPERTITLTLPDADITLEADAARLEQVALNLVENARKYSPADSPVHVLVSATCDTLTIAVEDKGTGVPPEEREHIFERFHRAANVDKGVSGLGLGLHIAREIVRAHGGTLTVDSAPGEGSTFTAILPLRRPEVMEQAG
jgi:signal transduction histidine kinase